MPEPSKSFLLTNRVKGSEILAVIQTLPIRPHDTEAGSIRSDDLIILVDEDDAIGAKIDQHLAFMG